MSPASNSKSKHKSTSKLFKEPKAPSKPYNTPANDNFNVTASAYDPDVDELEEFQLDAVIEFDSVSNISSEFNDVQKDKNNNSNTNNASSSTNSIPGSDADKREKIKLKNEKKHQRRKERRAQELHEKCCNYLTSRKLESLAQHLVSMGFTYEAATTALIHNEGRLETSASWLLDGGIERSESSSNLDGSNTNIDINEELSKIKEFEFEFKCLKQDVEKVVVACEGDLQMTLEALKSQFKTQEASSSAASEILKENSDRPTVLVARTQSVQLYRRDDGDVNCTMPVSTVPNLVEAAGSKNLQYPSLNKMQSTTTTAFATSTVDINSSNSNKFKATPSEKRWSVKTTTMGTPLQQIQTTPQLNSEHFYQTNTDMNMLIEPVVSIAASPPPPPPPPPTAMDMMKYANGCMEQQMQNLAIASKSNAITQLLYSQGMQYAPSLYYDNMHGMNTTTTTTTMPSSIATPSSLGKFTNLPSSGSSGSAVDWGGHGKILPFCDYTNIDWSLDTTKLALPPSYIKGERLYDKSLHPSCLFSSNFEFKRPGSNGGENGNRGPYDPKGP